MRTFFRLQPGWTGSDPLAGYEAEPCARKTNSLASFHGPDYSTPSGHAALAGSPPLSVKITLNTTSIPESRRPQVEVLVRSFAKATEIIWLPSRFPRLIMLVEPAVSASSEKDTGSIFESPASGTRSLAALTSDLEKRLEDFLLRRGSGGK